MNAFRITITMPDGSQATHEGLYADSVSATMQTAENFPEATRIEVLGLHRSRAAQLRSHAERLARIKKQDAAAQAWLAQHSTASEGARA